MDSIVTTKNNIPESELYNHQKIDASWVRLIYLAIKHQDLPANIIFESAGISVKNLSSFEYIEQELVCNLYNELSHYGYLRNLPKAVAEVFQFPFLRYSSSSPFEATDLEGMLYEISNLASQVTNLVKTNISVDKEFISLSFESAISDYQLKNVSIEIGIYITIKIALQIYPHISGGIVNVIYPKEAKKENLYTINNIPIIYSNKNSYSVIFHKMLSHSPNIFAFPHDSRKGALSIQAANRGNLKVLSEVQAIIKKHISLTSLTIYFIAEKMGISVKTIQRRLSSLNTNFSLLVKRQKIEQAVFLLKEEKLSIKQIAFKLGFNSPSSFTRAFKKWTGVKPSSYLD